MICPLCQRDVAHTTAHHLIPKSQFKRFLKKAGTDRAFLEGNTVDLCEACHRAVHARACEKDLAESFSTLELLRADAKIRKFAEWAAKQKGTDIRSKRSWG